MFTFTSEQLQVMVASLLWPATRILGMIAASPLFGNTSVPARIKVALGMLLAIIVAPIIPKAPALDPIGWDGLLIITQQLIIGISLGFTMRVVFAAVELAGEIVGMTMGLGFATFFNPQSQGRSSSISQFLSLMATMIFLAGNGHLFLISALVESFTTLPITAAPFHAAGFYQIVKWGGIIFATGVQISLPIVTTLLMTNIALAILTRAAPQLNLFGIGFPLTLGIGFIMLWLILPYMAVPIEHVLQSGFDKLTTILKAFGGQAVK